jgi:hypothetical protein
LIDGEGHASNANVDLAQHFHLFPIPQDQHPIRLSR